MLRPSRRRPNFFHPASFPPFSSSLGRPSRIRYLRPHQPPTPPAERGEDLLVPRALRTELEGVRLCHHPPPSGGFPGVLSSDLRLRRNGGQTGPSLRSRPRCDPFHQATLLLPTLCLCRPHYPKTSGVLSHPQPP